jgi:hypothetical protein
MLAFLSALRLESEPIVLVVSCQVGVGPEVVTTPRVHVDYMLSAVRLESMPIKLNTRRELAPIVVVTSRRRSALDWKKDI